MKTIDLLVTTWPNSEARVEYLRRTLVGLAENLTATGWELRLTVSSETQGVHQCTGRELELLCASYKADVLWHDAPANLGAHLNFAFDHCDNDVRMYCQDDWLLVQPLDIGPGADLLVADQDICMVRYYTAFTTFGDEKPWARVKLTGEWCYGDNPALSHRRWFDRTGRFAIGNNAGHHEVEMLRQARDCRLGIVAPHELAVHTQHPDNKNRLGDLYFHHLGVVSAFAEKR